MSLRWRITAVLIIIVALTVAWNLAASYYTIQRRFDAFVSGLGRTEASNLARQLSRSYTAAKGWNTVDTALSAAGYLYEAQTEHLEGHEDSAEGFHIDRVRVVILDLAGRSIRENFSELETGEVAPALSGQRRQIQDFRPGRRWALCNWMSIRTSWRRNRVVFCANCCSASSPAACSY